MADEPVTLQTFYRQDEVALARLHLESNGIKAIILDENTKWATPHPAVSGGMRLQVRRSDAWRAAQLLREIGVDIELPPVCPKCQSQLVTRSDLLFPRIFLTLLILPFVFLFYKQKWVCLECRNRWQTK